jgi:betaine-aldehyde dehydrogenase
MKKGFSKQMPEKLLNYIRGEWVPSNSGDTYSTFNPANCHLLCYAQKSNREDAKAAIDSARDAFDKGPWPTLSGEERARILIEFARKIRQNVDNLALTITTEMGKPIRISKNRELPGSISRVEYYAGMARLTLGEHNNTAKSSIFSVSIKEPVGVAGLITPWNDPIDLLLRKLAPALAAGCTVVIKPSSYTPKSAVELVRLLESIAELPKGVVNLILGPGSIVGAELVESPKVDKISFTGEDETGKKIMSAGASNFKRLSLECGGKAPALVFSDCNIQKAISALNYASFLYTGQSCTACTRLLIQNEIADIFVPRFLEATRSLRIGDPLKEETDIGPLVSDKQLEKVQYYVDSGLKDKAKVLIGGKRLTGEGLENGFYFPPTVFSDVPRTAKIAREEIFGPVLCVMKFSNEDEAIEIANEPPYGLASSIWTNDVSRAIRVSRKIRAGDVWINTHYMRLAEMPFGGFKGSGLGRELGKEGLAEYMESKHVCIDTSDQYHIK